MRGTYDLLHGDVAGMVDDNLLLVIAIPLGMIAFAIWGYRSWTGRKPPIDIVRQTRQNRIWIGVLVAVLVFGVVRNFVPFLGSGTG
jgi:membrane protease YdiL (CAAX protease family)